MVLNGAQIAKALDGGLGNDVFFIENADVNGVLNTDNGNNIVLTRNAQLKDIIGKKVVLLENLFPKNLNGIESNGMVLLSKNENGNLIFIGPESNEIESGTIIY